MWISFLLSQYACSTYFFLQRNAKESENATEKCKHFPQFLASPEVRQMCVQRFLCTDRQTEVGVGLSNPNQDSFLPLADRFLPKGRKGQLISLCTRSRRSAMHTMASVNSPPSPRGRGSRVGHLEKHPGPQRSTVKGVKHQGPE